MKTGDTVLHKPTGEEWTIAYANEHEVCPCGWPESFAKPEDCELIKECSEDERWKLLEDIAKGHGSDSRAAYARRMIYERGEPWMHNEQLFVQEVLAEVQRAREKFPMPNPTLAALVEEVGEAAQTLLKGECRSRVCEEALQVAAMAVRLAFEGDPQFEMYQTNDAEGGSDDTKQD